MYTLTKINIYPVKSLGGIALKSSYVEERGLRFDRRWMLVHENGMFFTQRDNPHMALLQPKILDEKLIIFHKKNRFEEIHIPEEPEGEKDLLVTVWNDSFKTKTYSSKIDEWFSETMGFKCKLVFMPSSVKRNVASDYVKNKIVSFADAYPFLIIGEESLNDLNKRMESPLPMNRFRTNFVFSGGKSFDEDNWKKIAVGNLEFLVVKPCARCLITTVDQETGIRGKDPLKTLASFRKVNGKVLFGQNMVVNNEGKISVGDEIKIFCDKFILP